MKLRTQTGDCCQYILLVREYSYFTQVNYINNISEAMHAKNRLYLTNSVTLSGVFRLSSKMSSENDALTRRCSCCKCLKPECICWHRVLTLLYTLNYGMPALPRPDTGKTLHKLILTGSNQKTNRLQKTNE